MAYFSDINIEGELMDGIGIFKSENRQSFLKLDSSNESISIKWVDGINIEKLDKGCLILNVDRDLGFKVCIIDRSNKSTEAQYWRDSFLNLKPCSDDYHHTKERMLIAKKFVTSQLTEEFEISKADQIELLNRSFEYFKTNDTFDNNDFEKKVFQESRIIKSFRSFGESYRESHDLEQKSTFEISSQAVKKHARAFKSVLKLDKNFHIYIHGDRDLMEQGIEKDGRKYYKIYFETEA